MRLKLFRGTFEQFEGAVERADASELHGAVRARPAHARAIEIECESIALRRELSISDAPTSEMKIEPQNLSRARPIVAIDGPVGAGKSTVARELARALGFSYLNTGAMYRAVAVAARAAGVDPDIAEIDEQLRVILDTISITFDGERVILAGRDISDVIIEPEIGDLASRFSALPMVREKMRDLQRAAGAGGGVVMEGRDIGTVIFPDAEVKFFLVADAGSACGA